MEREHEPPPPVYAPKSLSGNTVKKRFPRVLIVCARSTRVAQMIPELTRKGFVVDVASDTKMALAKLRYPGYHDAVLLDFQLQGSTGVLLAQQLRRVEHHDTFAANREKQHRTRLLRLVSLHSASAESNIEDLKKTILGEGQQKSLLIGMWDHPEEYTSMQDSNQFDALLRHPIESHVEWLVDLLVCVDTMPALSKTPSTVEMLEQLTTFYAHRLPPEKVATLMQIAETGTNSTQVSGSPLLRRTTRSKSGGPETRQGSITSVAQLTAELQRLEEELRIEKDARLSCERDTDDANRSAQALREELEDLKGQRDILTEKCSSLEGLLATRSSDLEAIKRETNALRRMGSLKFGNSSPNLKNTVSASFDANGSFAPSSSYMESEALVEENNKLREQIFSLQSDGHKYRMDLKALEVRYQKLKNMNAQLHRKLEQGQGGVGGTGTGGAVPGSVRQGHLHSADAPSTSPADQFLLRSTSPSQTALALPGEGQSRPFTSPTPPVNSSPAVGNSFTTTDGDHSATEQSMISPSSGLARFRTSVFEVQRTVKEMKAELAAGRGSIIPELQVGAYPPPAASQAAEVKLKGRLRTLGQMTLVVQETSRRLEMQLMEYHEEISRHRMHENFFVQGLEAMTLAPRSGLEPEDDTVGEEKGDNNGSHPHPQPHHPQRPHPTSSALRQDSGPSATNVSTTGHAVGKFKPPLLEKAMLEGALPITASALKEEQDRAAKGTGDTRDKHRNAVVEEWESTRRAITELEAAVSQFVEMPVLHAVAEIQLQGSATAAAADLTKRKQLRRKSKGAQPSGGKPPKSAPLPKPPVSPTTTGGKLPSATGTAEGTSAPTTVTLPPNTNTSAAPPQRPSNSSILHAAQVRTFIKSRLASSSLPEVDLEDVYTEVFCGMKAFLESTLRKYQRVYIDMNVEMMKVFQQERAHLKANFLSSTVIPLSAPMATGQMTPEAPLGGRQTSTLFSEDSVNFQRGRTRQESYFGEGDGYGLGGAMTPSSAVSAERSGTRRSTTVGVQLDRDGLDTSMRSAHRGSLSGTSPGGAVAQQRRSLASPFAAPRSTSPSDFPRDRDTSGNPLRALSNPAIANLALRATYTVPDPLILQHLSKHYHAVLRQGTKAILVLHLQQLEEFSSLLVNGVDQLNRAIVPLQNQIVTARSQGIIKAVREGTTQTDPVSFNNAEPSPDLDFSGTFGRTGSGVFGGTGGSNAHPPAGANRRASLQLQKDFHTRRPVKVNPQAVAAFRRASVALLQQAQESIETPTVG